MKKTAKASSLFQLGFCAFGGGSGSADFSQLYDRPRYNSVPCDVASLRIVLSVGGGADARWLDEPSG